MECLSHGFDSVAQAALAECQALVEDGEAFQRENSQWLDNIKKEIAATEARITLDVAIKKRYETEATFLYMDVEKRVPPATASARDAVVYLQRALENGRKAPRL